MKRGRKYVAIDYKYTWYNIQYVNVRRLDTVFSRLGTTIFEKNMNLINTTLFRIFHGDGGFNLRSTKKKPPNPWGSNYHIVKEILFWSASQRKILTTFNKTVSAQRLVLIPDKNGSFKLHKNYHWKFGTSLVFSVIFEKNRSEIRNWLDNWKQCFFKRGWGGQMKPWNQLRNSWRNSSFPL